jgi:tol-pal system protein YbgF
MLLEETQLMEGNLRTLDWMKRWIILVLVVLFFGCATSEDVRILDEDIRRFQSQLNLMQKDEDALKRELSAFQKKNQEDISALQTETKRLQTDLHLRLENLQSEMRILSTGVEEYKEFLKKPSREIDRVKEDIGSRTKVLEERGKTFEEKNRTLEDQTKALGEKIKGIEDRFKGLEEKITGLASKLTEMEKPPPTKEVPAEVKGVSTSVGDLYKDAYETFQKGNLEGARRKFEAFLKQYPNTELSDNAQFWIGETYFLKKDFEKAILEYEKAIVKYPEGDKIPAALFKQALAFLELGDKTNARNLLKRVIERYPHSEQAEMAKKRLEAIK